MTFFRDNPEKALKWASRAATTPKGCSCYLCQPPGGITKQEYCAIWLEQEGKNEAGERYYRPRQAFTKD